MTNTQQVVDRVARAFDHSDPYLEDFETLEFEANSQEDLARQIKDRQARGWILYSAKPCRRVPEYDPLHGTTQTIWWEVIMTYPLDE